MKYIAMKIYKNSFCKVNIMSMLMWQAKLHLKPFKLYFGYYYFIIIMSF